MKSAIKCLDNKFINYKFKYITISNNIIYSILNKSSVLLSYIYNVWNLSVPHILSKFVKAYILFK